MSDASRKLDPRARRRERRGRWLMTSALAAMALVPVVAAGGVKLVQRGFRTPRERCGRIPRSAGCRSNLRQIGLACHMFADDHAEKFPPDFRSLLPLYIDNPKVFKCPWGEATYTDFRPGGIVTEASTSYEYLPGRDTTFPGEFFLAFDRRLHRDGAGFSVLYCDAHVELWRPSRLEEFNRLLAAQEEVVEKLRLRPGESAGIFEEYRKRAAEAERK